MKISPDSLRGKIFLILIDKVLIGIFLAIVFSIMQLQFNESQRDRDRVKQISQFRIDLLLKERGDLDSLFDDYNKLFSELSSLDKIPEESRNKMFDINEEIVNTISKMDFLIEKEGNESSEQLKLLKSEISMLTVNLTSNQMGDVEAREAIDKVNDHLIKSLDIITNSTISLINKK